MIGQVSHIRLHVITYCTCLADVPALTFSFSWTHSWLKVKTYAAHTAAVHMVDVLSWSDGVKNTVWSRAAVKWVFFFCNLGYCVSHLMLRLRVLVYSGQLGFPWMGISCRLLRLCRDSFSYHPICIIL